MTNTPMTPDGAPAPWGRGEDGRPRLPMGAHWTDIPELVEQHLAGIQARVSQSQPGKWFVSPTAAAPDTVCTQYDGYTRTVGQFTNMLPGDRELTLHAHSDLSWCLDLIAKLRAQVAKLEATVCRCYDPIDHEPECAQATITWQGVTYNVTSWYRDTEGEWWRPCDTNSDGQLLMRVRGDNAYEPVPVSEIESDYGPLTQSTEGPDDPPEDTP
ncbi:phiSA1p31-related protein [Streptomyces sp. NPDC057580]|uniref:phiSA1p31-related protein n=1 Tax=Streptomyces sp. NPDC057580 TaxID=3346173 RepID=UPI0036BACB0E